MKRKIPIQNFTKKLSLTVGAVAAISTGQASTDYGPAIWRPACSGHWYTGYTARQVYVIHDMEGYYASTISYLQGCNNTVSVHYCVNGVQDAASDMPAGEITQMVADSNSAWTAGCWNRYAEQTEHEGFASSPAWYTEAMYQASGALTQSKANKYGIAKDRNHIIAHGQKLVPGWSAWASANLSFDPNCNSHTDPGQYWDWNHYMAIVTGTGSSWYFDTGTDGWTLGNSLTALGWSNTGWPGIIYADQNGNDAFYYSPGTSFTGGAEASVNVSVYPQSGTTANHDMQLFYRTAAENAFAADKSSPIVTYTAQNTWVRINLDVNATWPKYFNQTITGLRLDEDNNNSSTRWIINHVITQGSLRWRFDSDPMGWVSGNSLSPIAYSNSGWPGIIYADQTGNDPQFLSTGGWGMYGGINDTVHVRVYPQNGATANHDMQLFFATSSENFFSEPKSVTVYYTAKDAWADVYFNVGQNSYWNGGSGAITQFRLDPDQANQGVRWIVDMCQVEHATAQVSIPAPAVGQQPQSQTVNVGSGASFSVFPNGTAPFTFQWNKNGAAISGATGMSYSIASTQATDAGSYTVTISNAGGSVTSAGATLTVNTATPPSITTQPASQTVNQGANATFTVVASGSPTLTYQWRFNGVNISGATGSSYTKTSAQPADAGNYSVVVSNSAGNATSANAALTVNVPPSITTQPASQTVAQGANVTFSVTASGTAPLSYQWKFNGVAISGATASSYAKNNAQAADQGNYTVTISNVAGSVTSANASLSVKVTFIVDNVDAGFSLVGAWSTGTSSTDKLGADYRFRSTGGTGANTATWTANLPNTGTYNVYAWWSQGSNRSSAAPYKVNGGAAINVNQQTSGGAWNLLGTFSLSAGNNTVTLSDSAPAGFTIIADGVKWVQQ